MKFIGWALKNHIHLKILKVQSIALVTIAGKFTQGRQTTIEETKGRFFLSAQVVCSYSGEIISIILGLGHNNDQGMFNITGMKQILLNENRKLLANRGYSHHLLVTPNDRNSTEWNNMQKGMRSVVEVAIGMTENFRVAGERFHQSPEL